MKKTYLALSRTDSIGEASSIILDAAMRCDAVDAAGFFLYEPKRTRLRLLESRNFSPCAAHLIEEYRPGVDKWKSPVFKPDFNSY